MMAKAVETWMSTPKPRVILRWNELAGARCHPRVVLVGTSKAVSEVVCLLIIYHPDLSRRVLLMSMKKLLMKLMLDAIGIESDYNAARSKILSSSDVSSLNDTFARVVRVSRHTTPTSSSTELHDSVALLSSLWAGHSHGGRDGGRWGAPWWT
ncbi:hypothetical protein Pint_36141 [Pistacia integerrima]|uniref:Uncharacterized protein n=1 Tax=Pistacia integerrima TaxID=434235 RepID=A0ACC0Y585_9ROSI|nr:hypothetical protein Pint_36141 [Pistacia integerrima]